MHVKNPLSVIFSILFLTIAGNAVQAQDEGTPSQQLAALQLVESSIEPMTLQAHTRITQMTQFISAKGMDSQWDSYRQKPAPKPKGIDFDAAYKIALQRVQSEHAAPIKDASGGTVDQDLAKEKARMKTEWSQYENMQATMLRVSSFLQNNKMMSDYEEWSKSAAKTRGEEANKRVAAYNASNSEAAKNTQKKWIKRQRWIGTHWDEYMHIQGLKNDSGYIMERNRQSIVADSHEYPYLDSQDSPYSWLQDTDYGGGPYGDYWDGSDYGGYNDPYYDVWGGAPRVPRAARRANDLHPAYNRNENHSYHPGAGVPGAMDAPTTAPPAVNWSGTGAHFSNAAAHPAEAK
ncbi:MAG: hypothetical protein CBC35_11740 [Planctomycetes bacterium TMED75]|nr:hypothetical protein [Planctomycetaceae bacterium]OUU90402.1 MAG: hypothetical protein CBC35_11740 [Planctomycetes bacterium TMED75]